MRQAVILAGGLGTRLGVITRDTPKPLLPVAGRPLLDHLVWNLARFGINDIILATSYLSDAIEGHFADGHHPGVRIRICREDEPLGTGGALRNCLPLLDERFFTLNGDTLFDVNYFALNEAIARAPGACHGSIALRRVKDVQRYGRVVIDNGQIVEFAEKSASGEGLINAGIYLFDRSVVEAIPPLRKVSLEADVLPRLVAAGQLRGVPLEGYFIDIGLPETLRQADADLRGWDERPIAFLDRDGVINENSGYLHRLEDCVWVAGAPEAIRLLNESGYLVIVVTNQAGIARGFYTNEEFLAFMRWYKTRLSEHAAHIDDVFYSPYHPTEGVGEFRRESDCRKPNPGMLDAALVKWRHRKAGSFMIGDKPSDMEAARGAGVPGFLFEGPNLLEFTREVMARSRLG